MDLGGWRLVSLLLKQCFPQALFSVLVQAPQAFPNFFVSGVGTDPLLPLGKEDDSRLGAPTGCFKITFHEFASDFSWGVGMAAISRTVHALRWAAAELPLSLHSQMAQLVGSCPLNLKVASLSPWLPQGMVGSAPCNLLMYCGFQPIYHHFEFMVQGPVDRGSMGWGSKGSSKDEEGEGSCRDLHLPGVQAELAGGLLGSLEPQLCSCIYRRGRIRKSPCRGQNAI